MSSLVYRTVRFLIHQQETSSTLLDIIGSTVTELGSVSNLGGPACAVSMARTIGNVGSYKGTPMQRNGVVSLGLKEQPCAEAM